MAGEKYIPKVGDAVGVIELHGPPRIGTVVRVLKPYVEVKVGGCVRKFSTARERSEYGRDVYRAATIEPWTKEHFDAIDRANAIARLREAVAEAFERGADRKRIEALPFKRLEEAGEFLRALAREAAVKS